MLKGAYCQSWLPEFDSRGGDKVLTYSNCLLNSTHAPCPVHTLSWCFVHIYRKSISKCKRKSEIEWLCATILDLGSLGDVDSQPWCFTKNVFTFCLYLKFQIHYIVIIKLMVILYREILCNIVFLRTYKSICNIKSMKMISKMELRCLNIFIEKSLFINKTILPSLLFNSILSS